MNVDDPILTAYALGELSPEEKARVEAEVAVSPEVRQHIAELREFTQVLKSAYRGEQEGEALRRYSLTDIRGDRWFWSIARPLALAALLAVAALVAGVVISLHYHAAERVVADSGAIRIPLGIAVAPTSGDAPADVQGELAMEEPNAAAAMPASPTVDLKTGVRDRSLEAGLRGDTNKDIFFADANDFALGHSENRESTIKRPRQFAIGGSLAGRAADLPLENKPRNGTGRRTPIFGATTYTGATTLNTGAARLSVAQASDAPGSPSAPLGLTDAAAEVDRDGSYGGIRDQNGEFNTAAYDHILENPFLDAKSNPLSTFSIDVDTASYSNIRRFINEGHLPPKDAVRLEEMINYFTYDYPQPNDGKPFSINVDVAGCPWEASHRLVRIGLKGREIAVDKRGASNLVFLLDVSGSMMPAERLPLIKQSMRLLVEKLTENDRVAIVVYAGASGVALPSTTGDHKDRILGALENLQAGGSTNGAEGIGLAYQIAADNFIKGGVNRVILATDGDFNVGVTNQGDLIRLIQDKAKTGVFLSVLGVGTDNLKDSTMQKLADKGNGNYAYLDSLDEARKVLVQQMNGTLVTIAKDVKIQVEFNPARVASYRLIGYEKRMLRKEDFNNDKIDAGEIGAGHTVTALYEVVPAGESTNPAASVPPVDPLKYSGKAVTETPVSSSNEMLTVKLRHKAPDGDRSELTERAIVDSGTSFANAAPDLKFAAAVAEFGMLLRDSEHKGNGTLGALLEWAQEGKGSDPNGYRAGFIELVRKAQGLTKG